ncbi:Uncharacterised protein [Mycobacteroides abscessus subsp. abscessus]|nr:Uncharacterised protein [Mycobacteroides abscessus subsp. abscessus]
MTSATCSGVAETSSIVGQAVSDAPSSSRPVRVRRYLTRRVLSPATNSLVWKPEDGPRRLRQPLGTAAQATAAARFAAASASAAARAEY